MSVRSVQQVLRDDLRYKSYRACKKLLLNTLQKAKRIKFCNKYLAWNEEPLIDEATFTITGKLSSCVYCGKGSNPIDLKFTSKFLSTQHHLWLGSALSIMEMVNG